MRPHPVVGLVGKQSELADDHEPDKQKPACQRNRGPDQPPALVKADRLFPDDTILAHWPGMIQQSVSVAAAYDLARPPWQGSIAAPAQDHGARPGPWRAGFEDLQKLKERHAKLKSALDDLLARQKIADLYKVLGRL